MKISRTQLKNLINEVLAETGNYTKDPDDYDAETAKRTLHFMAKQASQLHDIIMHDDDLDPEVQEEITKAGTYLANAFETIMYDRENPEGQ